jgi:hypothetical protein
VDIFRRVQFNSDMSAPFTRRQFLQATTAVAGVALAPRWATAAPASGTAPAGRQPFAFPLLGDLHYDKLEHHDMAWVEKDKPNDVGQIHNYTRIAREVSPQLFARVRETVAELNRNPRTRVPFVLQAGDLVEGLCGSEELSVRQNSEALAFVRDAQLGAPVLFTKGNHDVTGPGSVEAFGHVFHPFLTEQARAVAPASAEVKSGQYTVDCGNAQFVFFDAYDAVKSLEWFESVAARRTADHFFVVVHPPVVPYGARSTWHIFSNAKEAARREKFLSLLGDQHALVLGGHIHKYNTLARRAGKGRFAQFALSSVLDAPTMKPKNVLTGDATYNGDQIKVEPSFSPANAAERRAIYDAERKFVSNFEYADLPGYAVVKVDGPKITLQMYAATTREVWRTVDLTALAVG